ncbi:MAG: rhomboid family intramembrane serine protease [Bacteroidota bacterium]
MRFTEVVKHLLFINIIVFIADQIFGANILALYYPQSERFLPLQLVTHFFMHANFMHIFFNMFALVMFGSALETLWGPKKFLFYYFVCAFGAAIIHMGYTYYEINGLQTAIEVFKQNPSYDTYWSFFKQVPLNSLNPEYQSVVEEFANLSAEPTQIVVRDAVSLMDQYVDFKMDIPIVGASGAIFGLLLAFGWYFPNVELMLIFLPIPIKAKYFIPLLMLGELYFGVNNFSWDNIAHFAHLGGALTGILLILYWRKFGSRFDNFRPS